ncbi:MAG: hypothetical protein HC828_06890 [Blastochloris sp.]|nr:hypothetical protein [Blastochloris sp.]
MLETSILAVVTCLALFVALKHVDKSWAAIGAIVVYYPVLAGLAHLGKQYAAADATQQAVFATSAEALLAQNNAFNPIYEPLFAVGILIISLVMLKGVFHKSIAYLGIVTFVSSIVAIALAPLVGLWYFLWWLLQAAWLVAAGWKLYRLGVHSRCWRLGRGCPACQRRHWLFPHRNDQLDKEKRT